MAVNEFTKDMSIISQLDDEPNDVGGLTSAELKAKFDEGGEAVKAYINETLVPAVNEDKGNIGQLQENTKALLEAKHTHDNKTLLDTYQQTEVDLQSAVQQKHSHNNKDLLDGYDQNNEDLKDAVEKKHTHDNKTLLDTYQQTEEALRSAVEKAHQHLNQETLDKITAAVLQALLEDEHTHDNQSVLDSIQEVTQSLGNAEDKVPSEKAVSAALTMAGGLPGGGTAGQALLKSSDEPYDMDWGDVAAKEHGTHVTFSENAPLVAGTAAAGAAETVSRSDHVHPAQTTVSGNAGTATKLETARTIRTNLASTSTASFDGSANVTPGVTGTLPAANGGTGKASWTANRLIYPSASTTLEQLAFPRAAGSVLRQGTSGAPYWTSLADLMTAMGAGIVTKILDTTTTADASQVNLSVSSLNLTQYSAILIIPNMTCNGTIYMRVNSISTSNYYLGGENSTYLFHMYGRDGNKTIDNNSGSLIVMQLEPYIFATCRYFNSKKTGDISGVLRDGTLDPTALTTINFVGSTDTIKSGSRFTVYGVK